MLGANAQDFRTSLAQAEDLVAAGRPESLFRATFPFPLVLSAATFCDKYGASERYNFLKCAPQLCSPVDFVFGQMELDANNSAFDGIVADIGVANWSSDCTTSVVPQANHFYAGCWSLLSEIVKQKLMLE